MDTHTISPDTLPRRSAASTFLLTVAGVVVGTSIVVASGAILVSNPTSTLYPHPHDKVRSISVSF